MLFSERFEEMRPFFYRVEIKRADFFPIVWAKLAQNENVGNFVRPSEMKYKNFWIKLRGDQVAKISWSVYIFDVDEKILVLIFSKTECLYEGQNPFYCWSHNCNEKLFSSEATNTDMGFLNTK